MVEDMSHLVSTSARFSKAEDRLVDNPSMVYRLTIRPIPAVQVGYYEPLWAMPYKK